MTLYFKSPVIDGQTVIPLPFTYTPGSHELLVFINGLNAAIDDEYIETSSTSVTFTFPLSASEQIVFIYLDPFVPTPLALNDLTDVISLSPGDGYVLSYDSDLSQWAPKHIALPNLQVLNDLLDVSTAGLVNAASLVYNAVANQWEPVVVHQPKTLNDLLDVTISTLSNGNILTWNSITLQWEAQSPTLIPGPQGSVGPQGIQGPPGADGVDGVQGPVGLPGTNGTQGLAGPQGSVGPQGIQGPPGADGVDGVQGPVGLPGTNGTQGLAGPQGSVGPQGIQGPPGADGVDGVQGPVGLPGTNGTQGLAGPQGLQGFAGIQGSPGADGVDGVQGPVGLPGTNGTQGLAGPQGLQGFAGIQGPPGADGVDGVQGPIGPIGPSGATWIVGATPPSPLVGINNDLYLDNLASNYYKKVTGTWTIQGNLKGLQGPAGIQGPPGPNGSGSSGPLALNDLTDVNSFGVNPGDTIIFNGTSWITSPSASKGEISSAGVFNGKLSVSYVSKDRQTGIVDLVLEVRNPNNIQVATGISLAEYFNTGAYYAQIDVGVSLPGVYLTKVTSSTLPVNNAIKIFTVSPMTQQGGMVVQESTRNFGETFTFRHVASPALTDTRLTIFNASDAPILSDQPMVELAGTGVYKYAFNPPSAGLYTGVMSSAAADTRSVSEVIFKIVTPPSGNQSVVIANRVGVGTREDC